MNQTIVKTYLEIYSHQILLTCLCFWELLHYLFLKFHFRWHLLETATPSCFSRSLISQYPGYLLFREPIRTRKKHYSLVGYMLMVDLYRDANCFSIYQNNGIKRHFFFKETIQCEPFFYFEHGRFLLFWLPPQNQLVVLDFVSYWSQSELAKMDIGCFGKY